MNIGFHDMTYMGTISSGGDDATVSTMTLLTVTK